jgi:sugar lactone lactonase YvrE
MRPSRVSDQVEGRMHTAFFRGSTYRLRLERARVAGVALAVCALAAPGAATAQASLLSPVSTFGSSGSTAGLLQGPLGVAVDQSSGMLYVADSANARIQKFDKNGNFKDAWGWGVRDGKEQSEVCTHRNDCQAGIPGSGAGQFVNPRSVAVDNFSGGQGKGALYVGDPGTNVVQKFNRNGNYMSTIDGSTAPQGHFVSVAGVAVDQMGNLWVADGGTGNVVEFDAQGKFAQQWNDTHGPPTGIAVDSAHNAVYLLTQGTTTERWSLTGDYEAQIDRPVFFGSLGFSGPTASALALDPGTGNLYVDHSGTLGDVTVYDHTGNPLDDLSLGSNTNSQGLAFATLKAPSKNKPGQQYLFLSDATNNNVTIYRPQTAAGPPLITSESVIPTGTTATLAAGIVPLGNDTTCQFQYVASADFQASGYDNATSVACTPADLGSSFAYQAATASVSGLTLGAVYHFRVVATNSAGTATGADQEFQAGPGAWAPFFRCPVDDPAMLASDGISSIVFCLASNSTHGSITIGTITTTTGSTNLQVGMLLDQSTQEFTIVGSPTGALVADPVQLPDTPVGVVTATTESAGLPSNFSLFAGIVTGVPIITLPIKIHLENPALGPSCFIGSDQDPILLNPANTDLSNAKSIGGFFTFDPTGVPDLAGADGSLQITGGVQGDDTFAVPGAHGCGPNGDGSLDAVVNAVVGLPSPAGSNHLVLDDAASSLAFPGGLFSGGGIETGQQFADDWHVGFGQ